MKLRILILSLSALTITACSGSGGGSDGGGSGSTSRASGPMSVKAPQCGGSTCISSTALMSFDPQDPARLLTSTASKDLVLDMASDIYNHFKDTIVPGVNEALYGFEAAANGYGYTTCSSLTSLSGPYSLGSGYSITASVGDRTLPADMTGSGGTTDVKFVVSLNSSAFAEIQLKCNSSTQTTAYVRLVSGSNKYEFWSQRDTSSNAQVLYGAMDQGTSKYTILFKTTDGDSFQLHAVGNSITYNSSTVSFSAAGGANLPSVADIAIAGLTGNNTVVPTTLTDAAANEATWSYADIRHCYDNLSTPTVTTTSATCIGLLSAATTTIPVRASATAWTVNGMNSAISSTF